MPATKARLPPARNLLLTLVAAAGGGYGYRRVFSARESDDATTALHERRFSPYTLIGKAAVSRTASIFTLHHAGALLGSDAQQTSHAPPTSPTPDDTPRPAWGPPVPDSHAYAHKLWSVEVKQPALSIARSYTPLPPLPGSADSPSSHIFRLLIRAIPRGEMSPYLHALPLGTEIPMRGPHVEADVAGVSDVVYIAAGTGVAPALQCAYWLGRDVAGARMRLLVQNRGAEDTRGGASEGDGWGKWLGWGTTETGGEKSGLVKEIEAWKRELKSRDADLRVEYFVDESGQRIDRGTVKRKVQELQNGESRGRGRKVLIVSGPEGFVNLWAGPKVWMGGIETQGPLQGILGQMDLRGWEVVKL